MYYVSIQDIGYAPHKYPSTQDFILPKYAGYVPHKYPSTQDMYHIVTLTNMEWHGTQVHRICTT